MTVSPSTSADTWSGVARTVESSCTIAASSWDDVIGLAAPGLLDCERADARQSAFRRRRRYAPRTEAPYAATPEHWLQPRPRAAAGPQHARVRPGRPAASGDATRR